MYEHAYNEVEFYDLELVPNEGTHYTFQVVVNHDERDVRVDRNRIEDGAYADTESSQSLQAFLLDHFEYTQEVYEWLEEIKATKYDGAREWA